MLRVRITAARGRKYVIATALAAPIGASVVVGVLGAEEAPSRGLAALSDVSLATAVPTTVSTTMVPAIASLPEPAVPPVQEESATYAQAQAASAAAAHAGAASMFAEVRSGNGPLSGIAALRQGQALVRAGSLADAIEPFMAAAADESLPTSLRLTAAREGSTAAVDTGPPEEARAFLARAGDLAEPGTSEAARMLWHEAQILRRLGDPSWGERALGLVQGAPARREAAEALDALEGADVPVAALNAAYVRYLARDDRRATALFREAIASTSAPGDIGRAWFYLGALAERESNSRLAVEAYTKSLQAAPQGTLAPDAYWWRGLLLAEAGQLQAALADFDELVRSFPRSKFAGEALLKAALLEHDAGRPAAERLRAIVATGKPSEAARASRWMRVLGLRSAGDEAPGSRAPFSFAALLEGAGTGTLPQGAVDEWASGSADEATVEPWLRARFGDPGEASARREALAETRAVRLAHALSRVAEHEAARLVWRSSVTSARKDPYALAELARMSAEAGFPDVAMLAAGYLVGPLSDLERLAAPAALLRLAYPAPFSEAVTAAASAEGVPPFLLLALMRQESSFQATARSPVGALGLTQVMPQTGETIAASLRAEWRVESLMDPSTSIRFGAHYLGQLLRRYNGNVSAALAGYNAGPGAADRWMRQSRGAPDAFYEAIDYSETRLYVEHVLENYGAYRFAYGVSSRPQVW